MKLSEAIKTGAALRNKGSGSLFVIGPSGVCSCALGAALEALGKFDPFINDEEGLIVLQKQWPELDMVIQFDGQWKTIQYCIANLNDYEDWTREQIADWLEERDL